ncbi:solute carrier family 25 member 46-like [Chrysoperla carnea]|uniref:solute carrier family 25 member 46-like n=1 Tax=Chrysoperla carnea TaxID=189513 RepID=UPI001D08E1BA|nr:solute carrier family 25 member 46-like [Chrysoperla carnea]XP_044736430.1 solute carrier family 25 member 46-like [Chrysoperla carnea]
MAGLEEYNVRKIYGFDSRTGDIWSENQQFPNEISDENFPQQIPITLKELSPSDELEVKRYVGICVGLVSLITENLLCHPFLVLRRQCQVHYNSKRYHIIPVTLVPVIIHLHQRQGITTLWKGIGSVLLVRGMILAVEDLVSKITPWPKEITINSSLKSFGQHLLLKCVSLSIITPFYSASLVETVQSDIASEKPGILDVFREGTVRLLSWGSPNKGRMLPVWSLVIPTTTLGLAKYVCGLIVSGASFRIIQARQRQRQEKQGALSKDILSQSAIQDIELNSTLIGMIVSDVIFYPFETILHRLHLQGTRTIVDNLDTGYSVLPILTNYEGAGDCYEKAVSTEGIFGLYKGFGALLFQFAAHIAVIRLTKLILTELSELFKSTPKVEQKPPFVVEPYPNPYASNESYFIP